MLHVHANMFRGIIWCVLISYVHAWLSNNLVSYVHVNTVCEMSSPAALALIGAYHNTSWCHLTQVPESFPAPSLSIMPFILVTLYSDWDSEVIDDGSMHCYAPVYCLSKLCEDKAHQRELQSFPPLSLQPCLHISGICFDLPNCPEPSRTSAKTHPQYLFISTLHNHRGLAVTRK